MRPARIKNLLLTGDLAVTYGQHSVIPIGYRPVLDAVIELVAESVEQFIFRPPTPELAGMTSLCRIVAQRLGAAGEAVHDFIQNALDVFCRRNFLAIDEDGTVEVRVPDKATRRRTAQQAAGGTTTGNSGVGGYESKTLSNIWNSLNGNRARFDEARRLKGLVQGPGESNDAWRYRVLVALGRIKPDASEPRPAFQRALPLNVPTSSGNQPSTGNAYTQSQQNNLRSVPTEEANPVEPTSQTVEPNGTPLAATVASAPTREEEEKGLDSKSSSSGVPNSPPAPGQTGEPTSQTAEPNPSQTETSDSRELAALAIRQHHYQGRHKDQVLPTVQRLIEGGIPPAFIRKVIMEVHNKHDAPTYLAKAVEERFRKEKATAPEKPVASLKGYDAVIEQHAILRTVGRPQVRLLLKARDEYLAQPARKRLLSIDTAHAQSPNVFKAVASVFPDLWDAIEQARPGEQWADAERRWANAEGQRRTA